MPAGRGSALRSGPRELAEITLGQPPALPRVEGLRASGYSQRELAAGLGISQRMVAYYEGETDYPPAGILPDLARVLGVSTEQLLGIKPVRSATKKPRDTRLWPRFKQVEKLPADDADACYDADSGRRRESAPMRE